jgi:hypothetical protein
MVDVDHHGRIASQFQLVVDGPQTWPEDRPFEFGRVTTPEVIRRPDFSLWRAVRGRA